MHAGARAYLYRAYAWLLGDHMRGGAHAALQPGPSEVQRQPETQPLATSNSAVLRALAEQTQKTVAEQAKLRPAGVAGSATAGAAVVGDGAGADGQHMNMIVDVVMQHLLSKDVLYTPMKVQAVSLMLGNLLFCLCPLGLSSMYGLFAVRMPKVSLQERLIAAGCRQQL